MQTNSQISSQIKVWDPLVRTFHWVLVGAFVVAFITEDDFLTLHVWAGYTIGAAIAVRLLWGFIGPRHARFTDFVTSPRNAMQYVKDTLLLRARRYIGHNPAGGLMIVALLISLTLSVVTGIALYGAEEQAGPMASLFIGGGERWEDALEEVHEFFSNFTMLLVVIHLAGVLIESLVHKENLVASMINGFKRTNTNEAERF
jgi:cytochrome b